MSHTLQRTLEELASASDAADGLRRRDEMMREIVHTEYLAAAIDAEQPIRVSQVSVLVFDRSGHVPVAIMVLGPP
ncbi:MAG TPA: hypothetical protein VH986_11755 [Acidimicrobiia bacterium]|jgi:DNA-binding IclR family transcriptional regulator